MIFLHPSGFWLLAGVAVFAIVCLLKPKYRERAVTSTYLWRLSERFRKKQLPVQRLKRAFLFLLQLLMLLLGIALAVQPQLALSGSGVDYVAILDASGSMQLADGQGVTRFARAQQEILSHARELDLGSAMTVVTTSPTRLVERSQSFSEVEYAVTHASCGWGEGDLDGALALAQEILWLHPDAQVFFYTDQDYAETENLTVVRVTDGDEWNVAITGLSGEASVHGCSFESTVVSYGRDTQLTMALYLDGVLKAAQNVSCEADVPVVTAWNVANMHSFSRAQVIVQAEDATAQDNSYWLFNEPAGAIRVLLVGETPFYLQNALSAFSTLSVDTVSSPDAVDAFSGYDIYVFDGCLPGAAPQDGSVFYINPPATPDGTGIALGDALRGAALSPARPDGDKVIAALTRSLTLRDASVLRFTEVTEYGRLSPVLLCGEMPVMLAGSGAQNTRQVVLTFDLHDSNLPLLSDFVLLIHNMLDYAMPSMLPAFDFDSGSALQSVILPFSQEVYLQSPDGAMIALAQENGYAPFTVDRPGAYTLLQRRPDDLSKYTDFFVHMPASESNPQLRTSPVRLALSQGDDVSVDSPDDLFDPIDYVAGLLLLILILECVVFNREQF